ncbi:MAG TPA: DUF2007 domain-containing protein [Candidatus Paceibacterota bacterium]|nr:DUF2007 domain-containing protein [Verrucomicrobiota bacterium]HOX02933.1 DUF2007 domain-containing protein [Verrucomicrobiota bacterium]HRZ45685.1 DUF2007 domain-containing protein [Candidatus Paceibacterota bacterium]HRZ94893.1 DUF2007 domain-containing protein [Candidatus Paceibacterota bacterium]
MEWVTIYRAFNPAEAQVIRSRLDAAGFDVNLADEIAAINIDGYSMAAGGIRVQVPPAVAEEARRLIQSASDNPA